jgi:glycerophosphoryl diester phosphodiesterase
LDDFSIDKFVSEENLQIKHWGSSGLRRKTRWPLFVHAQMTMMDTRKPEEVNPLRNAGADGMITDFPDYLPRKKKEPARTVQCR